MDSVPPSHRIADVTIDRSTDDSLPATQLQVLSTASDGSGSHDTMSPFDTLPAEIFFDIMFRSISFDDPYHTPLSQLHALAQVCVYWWHSIRSDPRFWREISLDEEDMMHTVLKKNPNGPLFVKCRLTADPKCDCTRFLQVAKQHAHRWKSATFRFEKGRQMEELRGVYTPTLTRLQIDNEVWENDDDVFLPITLPQLEHLDLSNTFLTWGELSGLKYLRLAEIPGTQLNVNQLANLLSSSPELEWLSLEYVTGAIKDLELGPNRTGPLTLSALRGLKHISFSQYDQAAQYLHRHLDAPHCYRFVARIPFDEAICSGPNLKRLVKIPMEATDLRISVSYQNDRSKIFIESADQKEDAVAGWAADDTRTPQISLTIVEVPSEQAKLETLFQTLDIPVGKVGIILQLHNDHPSGFSAAFWNLTTQIEFNAGYPHILTILQHLSKPRYKDGKSDWPCPRLTSIRLLYRSEPPFQDWSVPGVTLVAIQNAIRDFLRERSMGLDDGNGVNRDGEGAAAVEVTIKAQPEYIKKLRRHVAEGVQLVAW